MLNLTTILAAATLTIASLSFSLNHTSPAKPAMKAVNDDALTITSPVFKADGMIPGKYTCKGANLSPALHIEGTPTEAKSLTIIMDDPDAQQEGGFTHWMAWNLDKTMVDIPEAYKGGIQGMNDTKKKGYYGPCPPAGTHHYHFTVYALDELLKVPANVDKARLKRAMEGHILAQGELVGLFTKGK